MSQNLKILSVPKSLKVRIACLFRRGEPAVWFEHTAQPRMYRWNKFRSSLERRMFKEFRNSNDDSSEGDIGRCEDAGPSSAPGRDAGDSGSDSSDPE